MRKVAVAALLVLWLAGSVQAAWWTPYRSYRPAPTPAETIEKEKGKPGATKSNPQTEIRGTEQAPFIVNVLPAEKTKAEADQDRQDRADKASSDRWLLIFSGLLTIFNLLLVVVTGGLVLYT